MDEAALPILLIDLLRRKSPANAPVQLETMGRWWPMVRKAAGYLLRNGPVTQTGSLGGEWRILAIHSRSRDLRRCSAAADIADAVGEAATALVLRETADIWNDNIERWCYACDTELAHQLGVDGYYVRIAPPDTLAVAGPVQALVPIKNRFGAQAQDAAVHVVSPDSLALVRFGLRAADDPRILNTIKVIDALLRVELPQGPSWYRYNGDGYGEHEDGSAFDGTGVGRPWPLLTGERAHYELWRRHYPPPVHNARVRR
jgi:glucoamylase